jgi:hypothetical protein
MTWTPGIRHDGEVVRRRPAVGGSLQGQKTVRGKTKRFLLSIHPKIVLASSAHRRQNLQAIKHFAWLKAFISDI